MMLRGSLHSNYTETAFIPTFQSKPQECRSSGKSAGKSKHRNSDSNNNVPPRSTRTEAPRQNKSLRSSGLTLIGGACLSHAALSRSSEFINWLISGDRQPLQVVSGESSFKRVLDRPVDSFFFASLLRAPKSNIKQKERTKHRFWYPPYTGPWNRQLLMFVLYYAILYSTILYYIIYYNIQYKYCLRKHWLRNERL